MHPIQVPTLPAQSYNMDFTTDLPKALYKSQTYDTAWIFVDRCSHSTRHSVQEKQYSSKAIRFPPRTSPSPTKWHPTGTNQ